MGAQLGLMVTGREHAQKPHPAWPTLRRKRGTGEGVPVGDNLGPFS